MTPALPSNRSFGWTFTIFFILAGAYGLWHGRATSFPMLGLALLTAVVTLTRAAWLTPLNRGWMKFGELMGQVVSPVVLGVIFFAVFTPIGVVMRAFGRDAMCRRFQPGQPSYWVKRAPPGPADDSYRNMF
jgi:hypothetical protein